MFRLEMAAFTEFVIKTITTASGIALNPIFPATGLAAAAYGPKSTTIPLVNRNLDLSVLKKNSTRTLLQVLFALGFAKTLNRTLNNWAKNNWVVSAKKQDWRWNEEIAVVTGGCNGIGKAITYALVKRGVRVAVLDVQDFPLDMTRESKITYYHCDITSPSAVIDAAAKIRDTIGHPSILVNNAGLAPEPATIIQSSDETIKRLISVNLLALWTTTREFLPNMIVQNKGHIVTISSMAAFVCLPGGIDYSASKSGALVFHEGLNYEIRHAYKTPGVVATVVHPSWTLTNMTMKYRESIEQRHGKIMPPKELADMIIRQILSCKGGQLTVPSDQNLWTGFRGWPNWLQEFLRDSAARQL